MDSKDVKSAIHSLILAAERCGRSVTEECTRLRTAACQLEKIIAEKQQDFSDERWNQWRSADGANSSAVKHQEGQSMTLKAHSNSLSTAISRMEGHLDGRAPKVAGALSVDETLLDENRDLRNQVQSMRFEIEKLRARANETEALKKASQDKKAAEALNERALGLYKKTKRAVKYILSEYGQHTQNLRSGRSHEKAQSSQKADDRMHDAFEAISEVQRAISSDSAIKRERDSNQARCTSSGAKFDSTKRDSPDRNESTVVDVPRASETSRGSLYSDKSETKKRWFHLDYEESDKRRADGNRRHRAEPAENQRNHLNYKFTEVVRNRDERKKMKGHSCECCDKFFEAIDYKDHIESCSKHRAHFTPPSTAPDFWKVGFDEEETCPPADSGSDEGT